MKKVLTYSLVSLLALACVSTVYAQDNTTSSETTDEATTTDQNTISGKRPIKARGDQMQKRGLLKKVGDKTTRAHLVQAEITAVGGSTLTVEKDGKTYTVNTASNTKFRRHFWGTSTVTEFSVGNIVNIWGTWADETQTTINAVLIRNMSIMKRHGVFFGTVKSLGDNSFVITSINRGDQTVTIGTSTKLMNRSQQPIVFDDILVGHRVRIKGLWDKSKNTVTEVVQVKDFTLPLQTKTTTETETIVETETITTETAPAE